MPQEQQNIRRWLVRLTGPIFIEMVLIILLGIVDTVMLSQCSDNTVAAVGVVVQLLNMIFLVFEATTAGTSGLLSLITISEPTRGPPIWYAVFGLKKKKISIRTTCTKIYT